MGLVHLAVAAVGHLASWLGHNPMVLLIIAAVIVVAVLVRRIRDRTTQADPQRMFTSEQRHEGFARADNRCEMNGALPFTRCRRRAEHGDHFYPWSKGGATSMGNFVAACATCNIRKSDHIPSMRLAHTIARRRKKYFPAGEARTPGQRFA